MADLFTYRATIRRTLDEDTLAVSIALPDYAMEEKLRLHGLDCPELDIAEGKAAKRFVDTLLPDAAEVIVTTSKVDKYDRYLADVHVIPERSPVGFPQQRASEKRPRRPDGRGADGRVGAVRELSGRSTCRPIARQ